MTGILPFTPCPQGAFNPEDLKALGEAYDLAASCLKGRTTTDVSEVVAARIIYAGMKGQRDLAMLCTLAVHGFA